MLHYKLPLKKCLFPVQRVAEIVASRAATKSIFSVFFFCKKMMKFWPPTSLFFFKLAKWKKKFPFCSDIVTWPLDRKQHVLRVTHYNCHLYDHPYYVDGVCDSVWSQTWTGPRWVQGPVGLSAGGVPRHRDRHGPKWLKKCQNLSHNLKPLRLSYCVIKLPLFPCFSFLVPYPDISYQ